MFYGCTATSKPSYRLRTVERTNQWRDDILQRKQPLTENSQELWAACVLVPSGKNGEGDLLIDQQFTSLQDQLAKAAFGGIAFIGPSSADSKCVKAAVERLKTSSTTTSLAILSTQTLSHLIECCHAGVNILGTNLPAQWAKAKKVFVCDWNGWSDDEQPSKRPKLDGAAISLDSDCCYQIDKEWIRDTRPILEGCACMACQRHSRAYLYHLVVTKELLVEILVFIHNLHHLLELCRELSVARKVGKVEVLVKCIKKQITVE